MGLGTGSRMLALLAMLSALWVWPHPSQAQVLRATVKEWRLYNLAGKSGRDSCYLVNYPVKSAGNARKRGKPYLLVSDRGGTRDEVNVSSGYIYAGNDKANAEIDGKRFPLYAEADTAWATDEAADRDLVSAMKSGKWLRVRGVSKKGSSTADRYQLAGFAEAYKRMKALCGS